MTSSLSLTSRSSRVAKLDHHDQDDCYHTSRFDKLESMSDDADVLVTRTSVIWLSEYFGDWEEKIDFL